MNSIYKKFSKYLPILLFTVFLFWTTTGQCGILDWATDKLEGLAASALGISTEDNCVAPTPHELKTGESASSCLFCGMFRILYNAGSTIADKSYSFFHSDLGKLLIIFFAVVLAMIILRNIASMGAVDPMTLANELVQKGFIFAAIYFIVNVDYYNILNLTVVPIISTGLEIAGKSPLCAEAGGLLGYAVAIVSDALIKGIPSSLGNMIVCMIASIEQNISSLFDFADWAFCRGFGPDRFYHIIPNFIDWIDGVFLYIGGIIFMVSYPWVMADAVIQLGISLALLPFAVCGYAFNATRQYLAKVFSWIINSIAVFIFMSILITCIFDYINSILTEVFTANTEPQKFFIDPINGIAFYGINMVKILFVLLIGIEYMPATKDLADNFSSGSGISAAQATGDMINTQLEKATDKIADYGGKVAFNTAKNIGENIGKGTVRGLRHATRHTTLGIVNRLSNHIDGNGNKTFRVFGTGKFTGKLNKAVGGMKFTRVENTKGKYLKREFTSVTRRNHVMASDSFSTIKEEYTKSGQLIKQEVKFNHEFMNKYLLDGKGNIDTEALKKLLDSPLAQDPAYRQAILTQVGIEVAARRGDKMGKYFKSRTVTMVGGDPNHLLITQVDYKGKTTTLEMVLNRTTGQVCTKYHEAVRTRRFIFFKTSNTRHKVHINNGATDQIITGKKDKNGKITNEVTKFKYGNHIQKGHDLITASSDKKQVIDKSGALAGDINQSEFFFGLDDLQCNFGGSNSDFCRINVFQQGRIRETNKMQTAGILARFI